MRKPTNLKTIDLFAGCGGLSLGFQNAGFKMVAAVDNWEPAVKTYKENFDDHDIFDLDLSDIELSVQTLKKFSPDVIVGGPPCQDFSHAGKRDEALGRADLTISFAKIIEKLKPRFFVMENVDRIQKSEKLSLAKDILKGSGYGMTQSVLDASLCGAPQKRKRFFLIGILGEKDNVLLSSIQENLSKEPTTVRDYFGKRLGTDFYYRHPRNYNRRGVYSIDEPSATIRGVNRPIPNGYPIHSGDATKDISQVRPLTTSERAQIQTFPKDFIFVGSKTSVEQQIGNAVPVKLAEYVAHRLMDYINNPTDKIYSEITEEAQQQQLLKI